MKTRIAILLCLVLIFAMTGCGNNVSSGKAGSKQSAGVNDVLEQGMAEADGKRADNTGLPEEIGAQDRQDTGSPETTPPEPSPKSDAASAPDKTSDEFDVDLTALSATMVYSEVYSMMTAPKEYIGKTVKMKGRFAHYHDEATGNDYFACIIRDATACCAQGIEFVLTDDYIYPDDYPEVDEEICVAGLFDTYREGDYTYCTLRNAELL